MDEHTDFTQTALKPAMLPEEINQQPQAIGLYQTAIYALAGIGGVCVIGMIAIPMMGQQVSDGLIAIGSLAVGALAGLIGGQAVNK